jgi:hypothetical protein
MLVLRGIFVARLSPQILSCLVWVLVGVWSLNFLFFDRDAMSSLRDSHAMRIGSRLNMMRTENEESTIC